MIPLIYRFPYIGVSPIHHGFQYKKWSHDLDNLGARSWIRKPPFLHGESKSVDFRIGILFWWLPSLFMIKHHLAFFENASKPIGSSSFVPSFSIMFHPYPYYKYNFCCFPPLSPWHAPSGLNRRRRRQHRFSQTALLGDSHDWSFHCGFMVICTIYKH